MNKDQFDNVLMNNLRFNHRGTEHTEKHGDIPYVYKRKKNSNTNMLEIKNV